MSHKTMQYRFAKSRRLLRPVFGLAAAFAAVATLGLTVATPAALATAEPSARIARAAHEAQHAAPSPAEVAILPARIDVVVVRAKSVVSAGQLGPVDGRLPVRLGPARPVGDLGAPATDPATPRCCLQAEWRIHARAGWP